jgi:hypothetical protein
MRFSALLLLSALSASAYHNAQVTARKLNETGLREKLAYYFPLKVDGRVLGDKFLMLTIDAVATGTVRAPPPFQTVGVGGYDAP